MSNVKDYKVEISRLTEADGGGYIAHIPELDCFGDGQTMEDAMADVYAVAEDLIEIAMEDGKDIPQPMYYKDLDEFSGKLSIRLSKSLHKLVSQRAQAEDCSINQLINTYIAMGIGDAYGRIESLMERQVESAGYTTLYLSWAQEMWKHSNQQYEIPSGFVATVNYKGGRKYETGI